MGRPFVGCWALPSLELSSGCRAGNVSILNVDLMAKGLKVSLSKSFSRL